MTEGIGGQVFRISGGPGFGSASDAPKVSADDQKLAAALAAHPQTSSGRPRRATWRACRWSSRLMALLTAINLNTGDIVWQVPNGDTPDEIKNNPALKGMNIPKTGQPAMSASR